MREEKREEDITDVFAPISRLETVRLLISLASFAAQNNWRLFQMDIKSAFLNGVLKEEVYVDQPPGFGFVKKGEEEKVYKLKKALYGLEQSPRAWYSRISSYFERCGFQKCPYEHTLYIKGDSQEKFMVVSLYVDDLIFTGNDVKMLNEFKHSMMAEFEMTDLGELHHFLGIEVHQSEKGIFISQESYAKEVLKKFKMENAYPVSTQGSDLAGSIDDNSGYVFHLGSGAISWSSKKQPIVSLSTTEAEYIAASFAGCQLIWLRGILESLIQKQNKPTTLFCDNSFTVSVTKDPILHGRTKHIRIRYHFLREFVNEGDIHVQYCKTEDQMADIFTKPLTGQAFKRNTENLGVRSKFNLGEALSAPS